MNTFNKALVGRVAVLSPHLDDAVFSVGAAIARAARTGADVAIVTVFAGDPDSGAPAAWWDRNAGFQSEGEAARVRRDEDRAACALVGATPVWLPFSDATYETTADDDEVWEEVERAVEAAEVLLMPGFPLVHVDHLRLTRLVLERRPEARLGLYVEQPYAKRQTEREPAVPVQLNPFVSRHVSWISLPTERRDRRAKHHASMAYRSQLPLFVRGHSRLLGRLLVTRVALYEAVRGGERVAWLDSLLEHESPPTNSEERGERIDPDARDR